MSIPGFPGSTVRLTVLSAGCIALLVGSAAPAYAVPAADGKGYVDSTARCTSPDVAVVFGSTASSRVAICRDEQGQYEYRGVRVSDGAKLILPASSTSDGGFVAKKDGVSYTVTASGLVVSAGSQVIRDEPMVDFHGSGAASAPAPAPKATTPAAPKTTTPPAPPINPLPAEVGGSGAVQ